MKNELIFQVKKIVIHQIMKQNQNLKKQETSEPHLTETKDTFSKNPPLDLEEGKWMYGVTKIKM